MPIEVKMPALSPTMEKGTLAKWLIAVGDLVKPGDLLAEIETDKATMEVEAVDEGRVQALVIPEGTDDVPVGTVIARLGAEEEAEVEMATSPAESPEAPSAAPAVVAPVAAATVATPPSPPVAPDTSRPMTFPYARLADKVKVSPLAARIAQLRNINLDALIGSGPNGRIVKADLGLSTPTPPPSPAPAAAPAAAEIAPPPAGVPYTASKLSTMRKTIARRLTLSKQTIPHFYLSINCRLDALLRLRGDLNATLAASGQKLSVNDFLVKALALALERVPEANVQFGGEELYQFERVDVAMAVALDNGLVTPVIKDAAGKRLSAIAAESQSLATQAREGRLSPEAYQGGTVSISNLGMFGIEQIFPVLNPPHAMILGVGKAEERYVPVQGQPVIATLLNLTASFDHRAIDGAVGAKVMQALRDYIEEPVRMIA